MSIIEHGSATLADGSTIGAGIALADFGVLSRDGDPYDVLAEVPCQIVDGGYEPLVGLALLRFFDFVVSEGQIKVLQPGALLVAHISPYRKK